jgi:hypothetical protein
VKIVREYRLRKELVGNQTCYITKGAEVVGIEDLGYNEVALFAICDSVESTTDLRTFRLCNTYETIYDNAIAYVGRAGALHVLEIL